MEPATHSTESLNFQTEGSTINMVISNIIGGLGNQMFQYTAGRALSLERDQPLRLDVSGFADYGLHQGFELQAGFRLPG